MDLADTAQINLCEVAEILKQVRLFFQCENWFPLYETTVYNALCHDGTNGFAYIASTQFVIVFMAFVILTFRVAFWDIQVGDESEEEEEEDLDDENKEIKNIDTEDTIQDDENTRKSSCFSGITGMLIVCEDHVCCVLCVINNQHKNKNKRGLFIYPHKLWTKKVTSFNSEKICYCFHSSSLLLRGCELPRKSSNPTTVMTGLFALLPSILNKTW